MADQFYQARIVMPMSAPAFENGAILVRDKTIADIGPAVNLKKKYSSIPLHDLGEVILLPGLINAHCHLEYGMMKGKMTPRNGFVNWIKEIVTIKASLQEKDFLQAIIEGAHQLKKSGCTTIVNHTAFPELLLQLLELPLRAWHLVELFDIRGQEQGEEGIAMIKNILKLNAKKTSTSTDGFTDREAMYGIAPHAPQTASRKLYQAAAELSKKEQLLFSTHLAESEEEVLMFTKQEGDLFEFLKNFPGIDLNASGESPLERLLKNDLLADGSLLVHMNFLTKRDRELLSKRSTDFSIVHCPGTHRFFNRPAFDYHFFKEHGFSISLGTDSLASNNELNLFFEMQQMAAAFPELTAEEILKMVTLNPAAAIGWQGRLGELSVGAAADFITMPFTGSLKEAGEGVVYSETF